MKHVILIFEKLPGGIFRKHFGRRSRSELDDWITDRNNGWGVIVSIYIQGKPVGSLRVDESDPDSGPYLFLELDRSGADAIYKQRYVRLRVELKIIFRTNNTLYYGMNLIII